MHCVRSALSLTRRCCRPLCSQSFDSVSAAVDAADAVDPVSGLWAVVEFSLPQPLSASAAQTQSVGYKVRLKYTVLPGTDEAYSSYYSGLSTRYKLYITSGFVTLQRAVNDAVRSFVGRALAPAATARVAPLQHSASFLIGCLLAAASQILAEAGAVNSSLPRVWTAPFPVMAYTRNSFYDSVRCRARPCPAASRRPRTYAHARPARR